MIWSEGLENLNTFVTYLNNSYPTIKLTSKNLVCLFYLTFFHLDSRQALTTLEGCNITLSCQVDTSLDISTDSLTVWTNLAKGQLLNGEYTDIS